MGSNPEASSCCVAHVADLSALGPRCPHLCQVDRHLKTCRLCSDPRKGSGNGGRAVVAAAAAAAAPPSYITQWPAPGPAGSLTGAEVEALPVARNWRPLPSLSSPSTALTVAAFLSGLTSSS